MWVATIPAVIWVDQLGRKPVLISGALLMAAYVLSLVAQYHRLLTGAQHIVATVLLLSLPGSTKIHGLSTSLFLIQF